MVTIDLGIRVKTTCDCTMVVFYTTVLPGSLVSDS